MRIGLTYDLRTDDDDPRQAEFDPPSTIEAICQALRVLGHEVVRLGGAHELLRERTRLSAVDLVFNLAEGSWGRVREAWVPTLLDLEHVPYVGSDAFALMVGLDKLLCKRVAAAEGLTVPRGISAEHPAALPAHLPVSFPVIVKPRFEGSGRGIDAGALVHTDEALHARVMWLYTQCPAPVVVEEFIAGGELTVFLIGNDPPTALPVVQRSLDSTTGLATHVIPSPATSPEATSRPSGREAPLRSAVAGEGMITPPPAEGDSPALRGSSPWPAGEQARDKRGSPPTDAVCPLHLESALETQAKEVAQRMFQAIGCQDMARVDLRVDEGGRVYFLEINPLPSFDPAGSVGWLAEVLGISYAEIVGQVLHAALTRLGRRDTPSPCRAPRTTDRASRTAYGVQPAHRAVRGV